MEQEEKQLTLGQFRVGVSFNPGGHADVNEAKAKVAELIDFANERSKKATSGEVKRLYALAMTELEEAAMNLVKAITKPELPEHLK